MPNLPDIIEIGYSWKRLLVLLAGGVVLTAGSAAMAFHLFPDMSVNAFYTAVGYFGMLFFGFGILKIGWLLLTARGPVLFIDRNGIRDLRGSPNVIPWDAVEQIGIGEVKKQGFVTLRVTPGLEKQLVASAGKKLMRLANTPLASTASSSIRAGSRSIRRPCSRSATSIARQPSKWAPIARGPRQIQGEWQR